jgi:pimeloyl-ACP methyl ester carboxylesterase
MIREVVIHGTAIACWVNDGGFVAGRRSIVFVPGSGGNHTLWENQYKALQGEFNVASVNLPGHGLSGGAGERDVMRYVGWVKKTIGALGLRGPGVKMPVNTMILDKIHSDLPSVISMVVKFAISKANRDAVGPYLQEGLEKVSPDVLYGDLYACDRMDIEAQVGSIAIPALVVCGEDDKMTPPDMSRFIADAVPGAKLALIGGAGHYVMRERPEAFNSALAAFVRGLP